MSKQTAVEWLVEQMIYKLGIRIENTTEGCELFNQAKAMERQQIEGAYNDGQTMSNWYTGMSDYYNQEYKGGEQ
jgi:hypothetical protein